MSTSKSNLAQAIFASGGIRFGEFTLKSGIKSPYYVDLSRLLTSPENLLIFAKHAGKQIRASCQKEGIEGIASIELRGALLLSALATEVGFPCFVVRKQEKSYGVSGRIVGGEIAKDTPFMLFDDVVTDGQSKLESVGALEEAGAKVKTVLVVVDREQGGRERLKQNGLNVEALFTIRELLSWLSKAGLVSNSTSDSVNRYIEHEPYAN